MDVILQYQKAPQAVANFITLAQGTRTRIHPKSGAVIQSPMYVGEKFFRVINESTFKIAQTGSGTGDNSGGPGYTFKDEFDPTLTHVPYVLSMANSGPNTNGSQIFFTGNASASHLNNVHTVFGLVTSPASRSVIDAIHAAGNNGSSITSITFSRTDPAAVAFNEHAQNLPTVTCPAGELQVTRNVAATWRFKNPISTGILFRAFRSTTLQTNSWTDLTEGMPTHIGIGSSSTSPQFSSIDLDTASAPSAFYNLSVSHHPNSYAPSTLSNRSLEIGLGQGVISYAFNGEASGGIATYYPYQGDSFSFGFNALEFQSGAHAFSCTVENVGINPRYLLIKNGCDSATETTLFGRHSTSSYGFFGWSDFDRGDSAISR